MAGMPSSVVRMRDKLANMTDEELSYWFIELQKVQKKPIETLAREMAWRHGYGKLDPHYFDRISKYLPNINEHADLQIACWTKKLNEYLK